MIEPQVKYLNPAVSLCYIGLETAGGIYLEQHGCLPTTLLVDPQHLMEAYQLVAEHPTKYAVVPVPGLAWGWWALLGNAGMVWSFGT